ncbi:lysophospholipid acyltransferase family protein [Tuwongella immobilis]|uniref:Phospholipid/glycerol acyltransferase domain-containing protein n=1 Tax=Tuwongella immobilis TaxID=692036 RepID=A0A6C2YS73_9BACT|nr:lysophospholipid acyltransferase family protein [Tuwongella immobilis]VIP03825.1 phospholipid glycerol acyltransferase : Acyltransferase OS=Skermanella stibiiresistens SB22 GN=N825_16230 PE=4 SV=1: Acyltransferase [Tuwongella immobilis]VTS05017.1 phospholipid glycerol acyltransferase : Acyltransferase OS=Skermanella stibiiresistens SB22 GN=N825_16230 PE=4 SV=1: Acyltransferase [Tuwongella immobilis]
MPTDRTASTADVPIRWHWLIQWFRWYANGFVRKHFHAVRLAKSSAPLPEGDAPIIVVLNHPSWWDPMIAALLTDLFPNRPAYAPIHQRELQKYRFFRRLGFFGLDPENPRAAVRFLQIAEQICRQPRAMLWITAQGEFVDVRQRPIQLRSGVGHLAARLETGWILPLALEYSFWTEKTPEALARFGPAIALESVPDCSGKQWTERISQAVTENCDALAGDVQTRDPARFFTLLAGRTGIGGVYDAWRNLRAWVRGDRFHPGHAHPESPP